jgi:hypothetical protein
MSHMNAPSQWEQGSEETRYGPTGGGVWLIA